MKLLYFSNAILPSKYANSIHIMQMCMAFSREVEVTLIAPLRLNNIIYLINKGYIFKYYGVDPTFRLFFLPCLPKQLGFRIYTKLALWCLRRINPDFTYGRVLPIALGAAQNGFPVVYEAHNPVPLEGEPSLYQLIKHTECRGIVLISEALRRIYNEKYGSSEKYVVAHDGATSLPLPADEWNIPLRNGQIHAGYTGSLTKGRGIRVILGMARACVWADFHLVGGTPDQVYAYKELLKERKLDNVFFHGFQPPAKMAAFRSAMDVLLAPYQNTVTLVGNQGNTVHWMSPLKIFEYMSSGKPVLCSNLPVLHEIIEDGQTGLFCTPDSPEDWADNLTELKQNPVRAKAIGECARKKFLENYTWESRAHQLIKQFYSCNL